MKNDFGGLLVTGGDVTYVPHQNWRSDTLRNIIYKTIVKKDVKDCKGQ